VKVNIYITYATTHGAWRRGQFEGGLTSGAGLQVRRQVLVNALNGSFEGSIVETGPGSVGVNVNFGQSFKGDIEETDGGAVIVEVNGFFEGNIQERLLGNVASPAAPVCSRATRSTNCRASAPTRSSASRARPATSSDSLDPHHRERP
jgi:hypothetical protein